MGPRTVPRKGAKQLFRRGADILSGWTKTDGGHEVASRLMRLGCRSGCDEYQWIAILDARGTWGDL